MESNPRQILRELTTIMECSREVIRQLLQQLRKWILHKPSDQQKVQRISLTIYLIGRNSREPFLDNIISHYTKNGSYMSTITEETNGYVEAKELIQHQELDYVQ